MDITLEVLKLLKSKDNNEEQLENILFIFTTFDVLKLSKSTDSNEIHPDSIDSIFLISFVSK